MKMQRRAIILLLAAFLPATVATAAIKNWVGGNGPWSQPVNWDGGTVPANNDDVNLVFNDGGERTITYDVAALSLGLLSIDMTGFGATITLSMPNNNSLMATGIAVGGYNSTGTTVGKGALTQSAGMITTDPSRDLVLGFGAGSTGTYTLIGGALVNNFHEYVGLSGTGAFNHSGGTNTINANASGFFSVGHSVGATGTYNLSGTGALSTATDQYVGNSGTGTFNHTGGTNTISGAGHRLYIGQNPSGVGTYTISGTGVLTASNVFVGNIGNSGTGTLNILGGGTVSSDTVQINSASTVNLNGGMLRLNTVTGISKLQFNAGTLQLAGNRSLGSDPVITQLFGTDPTIPANHTVIVENETSSGQNRVTYVTGGTLVSNGEVNFGNGTASVTQGGVFGCRSRFNIAASAAGNATVLVDGLGSSLSAAFSSTWGSFGGRAFVTFANRATGSLRGTLQLAAGSQSNTGADVKVLTGATLDVDSLALAASGGTNTSVTLTVNGYGSLLTQAGASTLTVGHASSGLAQVSVVSGGAFRTGAGAISVNTTGSIILDTDGVFDARGTINLQGGQFNFRGGTLHAVTFSGSLLNQGGKLSPGSTSLPNGAPANGPGSTAIIGNYTQQANASLEIEIGGPLVNSQYDLVNVTGTALLDGRLDLSLINGFVPSAQQTFTVFNAGSLLGFLNNVTDGQRLTTTDGLGSFLIHYGPTSAFNPNQLILNNFLAALPADFDEDGDVDGADLARWQMGFGTGTTHMQGDADADGDVDGADFLFWQRQLGSPSNIAATTSVPEPASLGLLLASACVLVAVKRRTKQESHNLRTP